MFKNNYLNNEYSKIKNKYPNEVIFQQTVKEMLLTIDDIIIYHPEYEKYNIVGRLLEADRTIIFKVEWMNQKGEIEVNTGYRVQYNSTLGIYKGGIRFDPNVSLDVLKALAFEQTFKNALIPILMGGAKGGSDFNPFGRTEEDIMRFSLSFVSELYKYIGDEIDVPAGDLGVGVKEIGYLYGYYKKLNKQSNVGFTGKDVSIGGVKGRIEATGNGLIYFTNEALKEILKTSYKGKRVIVSGSGQVGSYAALKAFELGAVVVAMSDISGYVYNEEGLDVKTIVRLKQEEKENLKKYLKYDEKATFNANYNDLWKVKCDIALPCATQNELKLENVVELVKNGVILVGEGANIPTTKEAMSYLLEKKVVFAPSKAANAGGVFVSGLEIAQNHQLVTFSKKEVDKQLENAMKKIFNDVSTTAKSYNRDFNLLFGANALSFVKIADALIKQG